MAHPRLFGIAGKLSLLSLTFAVPTAYLLWLLIGQQQIAIDFADREVVADIISEIAAKANLLALNATIEAARAGDTAIEVRTPHSSWPGLTGPSANTRCTSDHFAPADGPVRPGHDELWATYVTP